MVFTPVLVYFASLLPPGDWPIFYAATRNIFSGHGPYETMGYLLPPWADLVLLPFVLFSENIPQGLMFGVSLFTLIFIMWRLRLPPVGAAAFLISPTAVGALLIHNIDPFVVAGILFPPAWGLFLLLMKPQIGFGLTIYYLVEAWRIGRFSKVFKTFAPISFVYILSMVIFPIWIDRILHQPQDPWNRSFFPYAIPIGIFLLWFSIQRRNPYYALASAPFFTPYLTFYTYIVVQIGFMHPDVEKYIRRDLLQIVFSLFLWAMMLIFRL